MDGHRGRLFVDGNRHGLDAGVSIDSKNLHVETDNDTWTWPVREVILQRWQGNQFKLSMGHEDFLFTANDPITFTFDVVDHLNAKSIRWMARLRPTGKTRSKESVGGPTTTAPSPPRDQIPACVPPKDVWTDLAAGRDEANLLEALAGLSQVTEHTHDLQDDDDHGDGVVRACVECKQVFIDLVAAEAPPKPDPWASIK